MKRSYDAIAGIYDWLATVFIGKSLHNAQVYLLQYIPPNATILIVGGGTGWILDEIAKLHTAGLQIDYVDISANMIAKAKARNVQQNKIHFIFQSAEQDFDGNNYDVILTPFFFDNFKDATMRNIFNKLHQKLKRNGLWLYADFQVKGSHKVIQRTMLFSMYIFFRIVCNIEARELPDVVGEFANYAYRVINSKTFKQDFIASAVYKKI